MSHCVIAYNGYLMLAPQGFDCTYVMLTPSELDDIKNVSFGSLTIDSQLYSDLTLWWPWLISWPLHTAFTPE